MPYTFNPFTNNLDAIGNVTVPPGQLQFLAGNSGGDVAPDGFGVINVVGAGSIDIVGNPGTHTLTVNGPAGVNNWTVVTTDTVMVPNQGYIVTSLIASLILMTLPAAAAVGQEIKVLTMNLFPTSFTLVQPAGVQVEIGNVSSTLGVGGSVNTDESGSSISLVCTYAAGGTYLWSAYSTMGDFLIT